MAKNEPQYHFPNPIRPEDVFDMYTRIIEEDFAKNMQNYTTTVQHPLSVFAKVNTDFVELEKKPINFTTEQMAANNEGRGT